MSANIVSHLQTRECKPAYPRLSFQSRVNVLNVILNQESMYTNLSSSVDIQSQMSFIKPVNVYQASNPNPMSANVVNVIFNQESMYANLSQSSVQSRVNVFPQTRVNVCHKRQCQCMQGIYTCWALVSHVGHQIE